MFEIPRQSGVPFAVTDSQRTYFDTKAGKEIRALSEREIERLYRERFRRDHDIDQRFSELFDSADRQFGQRKLPILVVAVVPILPISRLFTPTLRIRSTLARLAFREMSSNDANDLPLLAPMIHKLMPIMGFEHGQIIPTNTRPGFKQIQLTSHEFVPNLLKLNGWIEIHDDGSFLSCSPARDSVQSSQGANHKGWFDQSLTIDIARSLAAYWVCASLFKVDCEIGIRAQIRPNRVADLRPVRRDRNVRIESSTLLTNVETAISLDVKDLEVGQPLLQSVKPILDDLFSAFHWSECDLVSSDGALVKNSFRPQDWDGMILPWAKKLNVSTV